MTTFAAPLAFRKCSTCKQVKSDSEFYHRKSGQALTQCRNCHRGTVHGAADHSHTIYAAEYDQTPIPMPTPVTAAMLQEAICAVMAPADLDAWIADHVRTEPAPRMYTTAPAKGRGQTSRLTWDQIEYIRNHADEYSRQDLGAMFGITGQHAGNIIAGRRGRKPAQVVAA